MGCAAGGRAAEGVWRALLDEYRSQYPRDAAEFERRMHGDLPHDFEAVVARAIEAALAMGETVATRKCAQLALEALTASVPELLGGSADLTGSNLTKTAATKPLRTDADFQFGRHINYGVRASSVMERAIANGIALHGGYVPYVATFLTFADYSRNALRMAAPREAVPPSSSPTTRSASARTARPTRAVEQAASLRLIPNMDVWRPCDTVETLAAWAFALERRDGPSSLLFSRQAVPFVKDAGHAREAIVRGGYVFRDAPGGARKLRAVLIGTWLGSAAKVEAQTRLAQAGIPVRGVDAVDHGVRPAVGAVQVRRPPRRPAPRGDRGGRHDSLVEIRARWWRRSAWIASASRRRRRRSTSTSA